MQNKKIKIKKIKNLDLPTLLLVELVAHGLGELFELALGLCVVALDHDVRRYQSRQERFSRRWPCSR